MKAANRFACALMPIIGVWGFPASVLACPVCFAAKDEANRVAFVASTVFLTALPLILMGAFIGWAARRAKALDAPDFDSAARASSDLGFETTDSEPTPAEPSRVVSLTSVDSARS